MPGGGTQPVQCNDCTMTVQPNATGIIWPPSVTALPDNTYGAATIVSTQPVAVIVNDVVTDGTRDMATYNGLKADVQ